MVVFGRTLEDRCQSQNMRQKHLKQTVNATWYSWLKHLCQCTLIHTHAREQTFLIFLSYTGEIYWMKSETFSASAKINVRVSDPEIKLRNKFWILWVKKSDSSSIWFKSLAQIVHNIHDMGESHKNALQSYFTPHFSSLYIYIYITFVTGKKLRVCFWTITFFIHCKISLH